MVDHSRWDALVEDNLPPRPLWPDLRRGARPYPDTLNIADELLRDIREEAPALRWRDECVSYGQLRARVLDAAGALRRLGVQPADRVVLRFHNTPEFVAAWLAVQWIGAIGVPLPPVYRRREIVHLVNHSGASWVVCSADLERDIETARKDFADPLVPVVLRVDQARQGVRPPPYPTGRDAPALITYITSATGDARGVVHSPGELLATADTYAREVLDLSARDVCIGPPSIAWSFGLGASLVFPLRAGASVVLVENGGPPLPVVVAETRATILFAVPTMYRLLLRQPDLESFDLTSLRRCISAAEPLPAEVVTDWRARTGHELLDGLGTTELAHIFISARTGAVRPGSIGTVVEGYEARVVDEDGRERPSGEPGRLEVRGPTGARYWRDADAQRRVVRDGWTMTGDVCAREGDGWFVHLGRTDDLIVSGGYKISPAEVERALLDHRDVRSARVFAVADAVRGALPHATVAVGPDVDPASAGERLQQYLKQELAPYKCPRVIRVVRS